MRQVLIIICLVLKLHSSKGQNFNEDYKHCFDFYTNTTSLSMKVHVRNFTTKDDSRGEEISVSEIKKLGNNYYTSFNGTEMLVNEKGIFVINHIERWIKIYKPQKLKKINLTSMTGVDSLIGSNYSSVKYHGIVNDSKHYTGYLMKGTYKQLEMYFNVKMNYLSKLIYYFPPSDTENDFGAYKMEILYDNVNLSPVNPTWFNENKFVRSEGNQFIQVEAYKSYRLNILN